MLLVDVEDGFLEQPLLSLQEVWGRTHMHGGQNMLQQQQQHSAATTSTLLYLPLSDQSDAAVTNKARNMLRCAGVRDAAISAVHALLRNSSSSSSSRLTNSSALSGPPLHGIAVPADSFEIVMREHLC
jgi:hypothetical protein